MSPTVISEPVEGDVDPRAGWILAQHLCRASKASTHLPLTPLCPSGPHGHQPLFFGSARSRSPVPVPTLPSAQVCPCSPLPRPALGSWEPSPALHSWSSIQTFLLFICTARRQKAIPVSHPLCSAVGSDSCRRPMAGTQPAVNLLVSLCLDSKSYLWFQIED